MQNLSPQNTLSTNITKEPRNSNIELLRIISMLMILALHVNVAALGAPTHEETMIDPLPSFARCAFEMICIIAVNLFVLISGWFSIKFKTIGLVKYLFQCFFIITFMYVVGINLGYTTLGPRSVLECGALLGNAWFVTAYLGLYILAPVLNTFCENITQKQLRLTLILFYIYQTIYGNLFPGASYFAGGYSTISFVGLYLLARYLRLYGNKLVRYAKPIYLWSTIGLILWYYLPLLINVPYVNGKTMIYTCPLNITAAAALVLWFANKKPRKNYAINFIAASVFTVYLCHMCNSWTHNLYSEISRKIFAQYSGILYLINILAFILSVFTIAILLDQIRKLIWKLIISFNSLSFFGRLRPSPRT